MIKLLISDDFYVMMGSPCNTTTGFGGTLDISPILFLFGSSGGLVLLEVVAMTASDFKRVRFLFHNSHSNSHIPSPPQPDQPTQQQPPETSNVSVVVLTLKRARPLSLFHSQTPPATDYAADGRSTQQLPTASYLYRNAAAANSLSLSLSLGSTNPGEGKVDLDVEACFDTPIWISFTILDIWMWKYSSQADTSTDPDIPNIKRQSISELEGDAIVDGCNCESEHLSGSEVPPQFLSSRYLPKFL
ncbi:hypothetical protein FXO37_16492 [Capsicum annuum]|nr:hypothetical protein FXO37_16492 [Capsicum annuum]